MSGFVTTFFPELLLRSSALLACAWCAAGVAGRLGASAAVRHLIWLLALAGLLLLPLLERLLPPLAIEILPAVPAPEETAGATTATAPDHGLAIYIAVTAALLARVLIGRLALARLWRQAVPFEVHCGAELRLTHQGSMPMTWGTLRPRVLLPLEAREWPGERLRLVLAHELGHVARRDSLAQLAAAVACAFYWFNPGVWLAMRRLRIEQEHACDDLVLTSGAAPSTYAQGLLDVAAGTGMPRLARGAALAMARRSQLELRLSAILFARSRARPTAAFAALAGGGTLLLTALAAATIPVRAEAERALPVRPRAAVAAVAALPPEAAVEPKPEMRLMRAPARQGRRSNVRQPLRSRSPIPQSAAPLAAVPPLPVAEALPRLEPIQATPPLPGVPALPPLPVTPVRPPAPG